MSIFRSDVCITVDPLYVGHLGAAFLAAMKSRLCFRNNVTLGPIKVNFMVVAATWSDPIVGVPLYYRLKNNCVLA